jgi:glutathione peroxidase
MATSVYDFEVTKNTGNKISLLEFKGKALLIVNTASQCGFTSQYKGLESLYKKYSAQGFEVLAFPCNQFGGQEPGTDAEISDFCETKYKTTFPIFSKIEVNGAEAHPLYTYLKAALPGILGTENIKWNFTKFLVSPTGELIKRYAPNTTPEEIEKNIIEILPS